VLGDHKHYNRFKNAPVIRVQRGFARVMQFWHSYSRLCSCINETCDPDLLLQNDLSSNASGEHCEC